jgi:hypothetical protein
MRSCRGQNKHVPRNRGHGPAFFVGKLNHEHPAREHKIALALTGAGDRGHVSRRKAGLVSVVRLRAGGSLAPQQRHHRLIIGMLSLFLFLFPLLPLLRPLVRRALRSHPQRNGPPKRGQGHLPTGAPKDAHVVRESLIFALFELR